MSPCCCNKPVPDIESTFFHAVNKVDSQKARKGDDQAEAERVARAFGYTHEQLKSVPAEAHMVLTCGNPVVAESSREGETVVDLGSGGGIDVFLAASKVGPTGQVIGLEDSDDMIARARRIAATKGLKPPRVAFVKTALTQDLPIENDSVDCVLSDCAINPLFLEDKRKVMQEVHRILKPGGRVSVDDIIIKKPLPESLRSNLAECVGCIPGAILLQDYQTLMQDAGFEYVLFTEISSDLNVFLDGGSTGCCGQGNSKTCALADIGNLNDWASSYKIYATKTLSSDVASPAPESALKNWWDAYPTPVSPANSLECEEVADLIRDPELGKKDFVVVDVRRDDHEGAHVHGSIQHAAQTFYDDLSEFYEKYKDTKQVIFYCWSSHGRGPRCAQWYQDYLNRQGNTESEAFWMMGGATEWMSLYEAQADMVDFD